MALQINTTLTTRSGFSVPAGTYVWLLETRGQDKNGFSYTVKVDVIFFKDKAAFDAGRSRYFPLEIPENMYSFSQSFTAANYAALTPMTVHNYVKAQLGTILGEVNISIVQ
jgi:hypothetical protein